MIFKTFEMPEAELGRGGWPEADPTVRSNRHPDGALDRLRLIELFTCLDLEADLIGPRTEVYSVEDGPIGLLLVWKEAPSALDREPMQEPSLGIVDKHLASGNQVDGAAILDVRDHLESVGF